MWSNKAKQRFKGKRIAGSESFAEQVRGEVGRGRESVPRDDGPRLTNASRNFLKSLGEPVPEDFGGLDRTVHAEPLASIRASPGKVKRWQDMTEAERAALRRQYEKGVK